MSLGKVFNDDSFECLRDIANECERPIIVTDPPFNVGYHYRTYHDRMDADEYFSSLASMFSEYPSVVIHYPESLHRLSIDMGVAPDRVVSWVYPSNTARQHRDIAFYGVKPDFKLVRRPYRNPNDKRVRELQKRTGGVAHTTGLSETKSRTCLRRRPHTRARCRSRSWMTSSAGYRASTALRSSTRSLGAGPRASHANAVASHGLPSRLTPNTAES